jgi:hypothetical protein
MRRSRGPSGRIAAMAAIESKDLAMKSRLLPLLLAFAAAAPTHARSVLIESLAEGAGLRTSQVRMLLAPAPGAHPGWRDYRRVERRLIGLLGERGYADLRAGREVRVPTRAVLVQRDD